MYTLESKASDDQKTRIMYYFKAGLFADSNNVKVKAQGEFKTLIAELNKKRVNEMKKDPTNEELTKTNQKLV